ncbi:MAG: PRC-barrel domain-containing protein [Alphaproteobacteria bacterium]|nr:PRC-barrel domain-containing protein [Alphaproteobacteria bacterium]
MRNFLLSTACAAAMFGAMAVAADNVDPADPGSGAAGTNATDAIPNGGQTPADIMPGNAPQQSTGSLGGESYNSGPFANVDAKSLIGAQVLDAQGKAVGDIADLVVDDSDSVQSVIVALDSETKVRIDASEFQTASGSQSVSLKTMRLSQAEEMPAWTDDMGSRLASSHLLSQGPAADATAYDRSASSDAYGRSQSPMDSGDSAATYGDGQSSPSGLDLTRQVQDDAPDAFAEMSPQDIIGSEVNDENGQKVGNIDDFVLDDDGHVEAVILAYGGFLGLGESHVRIEARDVTLEQGAGGFTLEAMSLDEIKALPKYEVRATDQLYSQHPELFRRSMGSPSPDVTRDEQAPGTAAPTESSPIYAPPSNEQSPAGSGSTTY